MISATYLEAELVICVGRSMGVGDILGNVSIHGTFFLHGCELGVKGLV